MGQVTPLLREIRGMQTDPAIDQMPDGFVRQVKDFIPRPVFAAAESRGVWTWKTGQIATGAGTDRYNALTYCPFSSGEKILLTGVGDVNGPSIAYVTALDGATTGTLMTGATSLPLYAPTFHRTPTGGLAILPAIGAALVPMKWTGASAALANLGGSPPTATMAASWGDYLILAADANDPTHDNRLWFSGVGNPESWPANNYIDLPESIRAVVPKGNTIFVFGDKGVHLLLGDTPPPGGNLTLRKFAFGPGLPRSFGSFNYATALYKDYVIWASPQGVFKSDGSQPIDLTKLGGISSLWPFMYDPKSAETVAIGVFRNYLFVSTLTNTQVVKRTLIYDLEENTWWEWGNVAARRFTPIPGFGSNSSDDLLWVDRPNRKITGIASMFTSTDAAGTVQDANGVSIDPEIVTGAYRVGGFGKKRVRRGYVTYSIRSGDALTVQHSWDVAPSPAADPTSFALTDEIHAAQVLGPASTVSNRVTRRVIRLDREVEMLQFKLQGFGPGLRVYGIEVEVSPHSSSRGGDVGA